MESLYLLQSTHFSQVKIELPCSGVTNHQDLIPSKVDLLRQLDGLEHGCCEKREELFEVIARDRYAELFGPTVGDKVAGGVLERLGEDGGELPEFQHLEDLEDLDLIILILRRKIQKEIWELKSKHEMQWNFWLCNYGPHHPSRIKDSLQCLHGRTNIGAPPCAHTHTPITQTELNILATVYTVYTVLWQRPCSCKQICQSLGTNKKATVTCRVCECLWTGSQHPPLISSSPSSPLLPQWILVHVWCRSCYDSLDCVSGFGNESIGQRRFGVGNLGILGILSRCIAKWTWDSRDGPPSATRAFGLGILIGLSDDRNKSSLCKRGVAWKSAPSKCPFCFDPAFKPWIWWGTQSNSTQFKAVEIGLRWPTVVGISMGREIDRNMGCNGRDEQDGFGQIPCSTWFWYPPPGDFSISWQATTRGLTTRATSVEFSKKHRTDSMVQRSPDSDPSHRIPLSTRCNVLFIFDAFTRDGNECSTNSSSLGFANGLPNYAQE